MRYFTPKQIKEYIGYRGIPTIECYEGDEMEDAYIQITEEVHIQIGYYENYYIVCKELQNGDIEFGPMKETLNDMIIELKKVLKMKK